MRHILEADAQGWTLIHELGCPQDLLRCELTQILREFHSPPETGRFEVRSRRAKDGTFKLMIGEEVPFWVRGATDRRTGHVWNQDDEGISFGRKQ